MTSAEIRRRLPEATIAGRPGRHRSAARRTGRHRPATVAGALVALLAVATATPAPAADLLAQEPQAAPAIEIAPGWTFTFAPYFWMAGMSGNVAAFGSPPVNVDASFTDIVEALDFAGMAVAEARYGRFSLSSDLLYLKVSTDQTTPRGILASQVQLGAKTFEFTALGGYAIVDTATAHLDVVAGTRVWAVDETLSFAGGALNGLSFNDSKTWVDAMAGLKGRASLTPEVYLTGWALAGGGGSDLGWDVFGGLGYEFTDHFSAMLGYRAAGVDYQDGSFLFDVTIQGPILGAVVRF